MPDGVMQGVIWAVCHICKLRLWQWEMVKLILYGLVYCDEQTCDLIEIEYVTKSRSGISVVQEQVKPYVLLGSDSEEGSSF